MNKKVFISMLVLTISFLVGLYVAKIFFPQEFVMSIQNENLIKIGAYIDNHKWLYYLCTGVTAFITYWLYCCACKGKWYLNWKEVLVIIAFIVVVRFMGFVDYNVRSHISISSFFIIPLIFKHDLKRATIIYTVHGFAQVLSLVIRDLPMYLRNVSFLVTTFMLIECYFWLLLFYIIYNYNNKGEIKND